MIKIYDGRENFYQWDLNRKLTVLDPEVTEVHFCNGTDSCSLVVEVKEMTVTAGGKETKVRVVDVPNILLQSALDIRVYACHDECTSFEETFKVKGRTKPEDYVYTETEILRYEELEARIEDIDARVKELESGEGESEAAAATYTFETEIDKIKSLSANDKAMAEEIYNTFRTTGKLNYALYMKGAGICIAISRVVTSNDFMQLVLSEMYGGYCTSIVFNFVGGKYSSSMPQNDSVDTGSKGWVWHDEPGDTVNCANYSWVKLVGQRDWNPQQLITIDVIAHGGGTFANESWGYRHYVTYVNSALQPVAGYVESDYGILRLIDADGAYVGSETFSLLGFYAWE